MSKIIQSEKLERDLNDESSENKNIFLGLGLLSIVLFFLVHLKFVTNIPIDDDYDTSLNFLIRYLEQNSLLDKTKLVFEQHNEHRLVISNLIHLGYFKIFNQINFIDLILISHVAFIGFFILLLATPIDIDPKIKFGLISIFLFQIQYWNGSFWTTASLQFFFLFFFSYLSLFLLIKKKNNYFFLALLFAVLACFTCGGGMLIFFIGLTFLFIEKEKPWKTSLWVLIGVIAISLYFYQYKHPSHHPSIIKAFYNPFNLIVYFLCFTASVFEQIGLKYVLCVILGLALFSWFLYLIKVKYYKKNPYLFYLMLLLYLTAVTAALSRSSMAVSQAFSSRYKIYSSLILLLSIISYLEINKGNIKKSIYNYLALFCFCFFVFSYSINIKNVKEFNEQLILGAKSYLSNNSAIPLKYPSEDFPRAILKKAKEKNIYSIEDGIKK